MSGMAALLLYKEKLMAAKEKQIFFVKNVDMSLLNGSGSVRRVRNGTHL